MSSISEKLFLFAHFSLTVFVFNFLHGFDSNGFYQNLILYGTCTRRCDREKRYGAAFHEPWSIRCGKTLTGTQCYSNVSFKINFSGFFGLRKSIWRVGVLGEEKAPSIYLISTEEGKPLKAQLQTMVFSTLSRTFCAGNTQFKGQMNSHKLWSINYRCLVWSYECFVDVIRACNSFCHFFGFIGRFWQRWQWINSNYLHISCHLKSKRLSSLLCFRARFAWQ